MPDKQRSEPERELSRGEMLERLVDQAREDPAFLHALVFAPERALDKLEYLGRRQKGRLVAIRPEDIISGMVGVGGFGGFGGGDLGICDYSCASSCDSTCGSGSCFGTCFSSCGGTCGAKSCDITVELTSRLDLVSQPWEAPRAAFRSWSRR